MIYTCILVIAILIVFFSSLYIREGPSADENRSSSNKTDNTVLGNVSENSCPWVDLNIASSVHTVLAWTLKDDTVHMRRFHWTDTCIDTFRSQDSILVMNAVNFCTQQLYNDTIVVAVRTKENTVNIFRWVVPLCRGKPSLEMIKEDIMIHGKIENTSEEKMFMTLENDTDIYLHVNHREIWKICGKDIVKTNVHFHPYANRSQPLLCYTVKPSPDYSHLTFKWNGQTLELI